MIFAFDRKRLCKIFAQARRWLAAPCSLIQSCGILGKLLHCLLCGHLDELVLARRVPAGRCASRGRAQSPVRLGLPDHPTPSSLPLAAEYYPGPDRIVRAVGAMCDLPDAVIEAACAEAVAARGDVPIDKPDPSFKGPF